MKTINLFFLLTLTLIFTGCDKDNDHDKQESDDPAVPIVLNRRTASVDITKTTDRIHIISGNGDYRIVFPKYISVDSDVKVDYSEDILYVYIDDEKDDIVIERKILTDQFVSGYFMVIDGKDSKRLFLVQPADMIGGIYDSEVAEAEESLINNPDYWQ